MAFFSNVFLCNCNESACCVGSIWRYAGKINCQICFLPLHNLLTEKKCPAGVHLMLKATKKAHCVMRSCSFLTLNVLQLTIANKWKCAIHLHGSKRGKQLTYWIVRWTGHWIENELFSHITQSQIGQTFTPLYRMEKKVGCRFDEAKMMALVFL